MTVFAANDPVPSTARGAAIALGNFDGVHLGHRAVLASAQTAAQASGAALAAAVFEPHPRRVLHPDAPPFRLQSPGQRARALRAAGVQPVFEIRFDQALLQYSDVEFAERVLAEQLGVSHVSVGANFRFGHERRGDAETLRWLGERLGFSVSTAPVLRDAAGAKFSSSMIREAIARGDVAEAQVLLTRPWAIEGEVQRGFARGRKLGFATANLKLGDYQRPRLGIYAVRADIGDGVLRAGVASIGLNPTFGKLPEPVLEAHLFDFDGDLYGRLIEVELLAFLREEAAFENAETLARQIAEDVAQARALLQGS